MTIENSKTVAFIVARLSSSRFPSKQLRTIGDCSLLAWCLYNLKKAQSIDSIVLATPAEENNRPLQRFAEENNIECFWYEGHPNEVTTRLCKAAEKYKADICVLISGDCPLIDGQSIDEMISLLESHPDKDYITLDNDKDKQQCLLQGVLVARSSAWYRAEELSITPELKEHHFPIIYCDKLNFSPLKCLLDSPVYGQFHRLSIDTYADYTFFLRVYDQLSLDKNSFTLENVVALLQENPTLKQINKHVYQRKVLEIIPNILFIAPQTQSEDTHSDYFQKINIETALTIIESRGWPVHFVTNDNSLSQELEDKGIRSHFYMQFSEIERLKLLTEGSSHLIIDNQYNQFDQDEIQQLISFSNSSILLGEGKSPSQHEASVLRIPDFYNKEWTLKDYVERISSHILKMSSS